MAANLGNFAFHIVVSRRLGAVDYGQLASLLAVLVALSLPTSALQVCVTRAGALRIGAGAAFSIDRLVRRVVRWALRAAVVVAVASPLVRSGLRLDTLVSVWLLAVYLVPTFAAAIGRGVLLAEGRFRAVAVTVLATTGLRLVLAAVLVRGTQGVAVALAVTVFAEAVSAVAFLQLARTTRRAAAPSLAVPWREGFSAAVAVTGLWAFLGVDVVLARRLLPGADAGVYAAAATIARSAMFLPQSVAVLAHARASGATRAEAARVLRAALAATLAVCAAVAAMVTALGGPLLGSLFGAQFTPGRGQLAALCLLASAAAVANLFLQYRLARGRRPAGRAWVGLVGAVVLAGVWHGSGSQLALAIAAAGVLSALALHPGDEWRARAGRPDRSEPPGPTVLDGLDGPAELDVSIVVPFFNPGPAVAAHVRDVAAALRGQGVAVEVIAVDDGSTDGSGELVDQLGEAIVRRLRLPENQGKGEALRQGFRTARGALVGFIDGDGDLDAEHLREAVHLAVLYDADVVVGSKRHPDSRVAASGHRLLCSRVYGMVVRGLFRLPVGDTQVGLKLFRRSVLADVLPHTSERGFVFDLELLALAHRRGHRRLVESPVRLARQGGSTIRPGTALRMLRRTVQLRLALTDDRATRCDTVPPAPGRGFPLPAAGSVPPPAAGSVPAPAAQIVPVPAGELVPLPSGELVPLPSGELVPLRSGELVPPTAVGGRPGPARPRGQLAAIDWRPALMAVNS
jgi:O-antigen/teichoic acid export membrane protein